MNCRIVVADDHEMVRWGVASLLRDSEFEIVGEASNGREAVEVVKIENPQILLLDVRMADGDGLAALGRVKLECPEVAVLMFSAYDNPNYVARAVALGAAGFMLKTAGREVLLQRLRLAARGEQTWERAELRRVTGALASPSPNLDAEIPFTRREQDVLSRLAEGLTNRQIAADMKVSYETVKEHVQHVLRKIGVSDRTQAAVWAVRRGLA
jgi:DNA-binding NarL/FixJ family response regulator